MADQKRLTDEFEPVSYQAWKEKVVEQLGGAPFDKKLTKKTPEGIVTRPVYGPEDAEGLEAGIGLPGQAPFTRGSAALGASGQGWDIRVEVAEPELERAAERVHEALHKGGRSLRLVLDRALARGLDPRADEALAAPGGGIALTRASELGAVLDGIELGSTPLAFDCGSAALPTLAALAGLAHERGAIWRRLSGVIEDDPLGQLARDGVLPEGLERRLRLMKDTAEWTTRHAPGMRSVSVSTLVYREGGAHAVQELAYALATGVAYLRALTEAGLSLEAATSRMLFQLGLDRDLFMELAKLRALRRLWARVVEACGGDESAQALALHARSLDRRRTRRDPWVNMLRATVEGFVGATGGADAVTLTGFDEALGLPDELGRRIARNTQIILNEESHLDHVVDPAGGSWYVETLTDELAKRAWAEFQRIERDGGMAALLTSGAIAREVAASAAGIGKEVAKRKRAVTGVSSFAHIGEAPVERPDAAALTAREAAATRLAEASGLDEALEPVRALFARNKDALVGHGPGEITEHAIEAVSAGASFGALAALLAEGGTPLEAPAVVPVREAADFEALRDASDAALAADGKRPQIFLANIGPIPKHKARAMFAQNFFAAGGIEPLGNDGFADAAGAAAAFAESGAPLAVICSSDELYIEHVPAVAGALKKQGAKKVLVAGRAGDAEEAWRAAGVDDFIYLGCDVHGTLCSLLEALEVIR